MSKKQHSDQNKATGSHFAEGGGSKEPAAKGKGKHRGLVIALCVVGGIAALYALVAVFFMFHFYPNTTLNGEDVSLASISAIRDSLDETIAGYEATVEGDGLDVSVSAADIALDIDDEALQEQIASQQSPWTWPVGIAGSHVVEAATHLDYDEDKLAQLLADPVAQINASATQTTNATIAYDETAGSFQIVPEVYGSTIDSDALLSNVGKGILDLEKVITVDKTSLAQPTISSTDTRLAAACSEANSYVTLSIPVTLGGSVAYTVDGSVIKDFVKVGDDLSVSVDSDAVSSWVSSTLAAQLDTVGTTRTYTRPDGVQITVSGGDYGWDIDEGATAASIASAIQAKDSSGVEATCTQSAQAYNGAGAQDWGSTYVDVDISDQYVRYYQDGSLVWESSCVTGNPNQGNGTPVGVYDLNNKARNQTLIGLDNNNDGEPDYKTPVSYWMPFKGNAVGLHDAPWRSSFGSNIYTYNGSHGCVNLPADKAASLYDLISVGTVVVVHD
ncbi:MAG: L,D-transpeptidase/peptidoglycan binding protein [Atopobiaceae bacterium]|jgi:lipoprotein-anchoring transpeptidase ErfK/SrfK|nr:L,D-transpeptidase/peptidoglycan binding protein [Atopobiaceae bacterium]